jgi:Fungal Zn(2)-Cys(6) binuclear cluster domain
MSFPPSHHSGAEGPSKVPIPRIETRRYHQVSRRAAPPHRDRVLIACTNCRERKVRCDGGQPQCQNCLDSTRQCVYLESRKSRLKTLVTLLNDLAIQSLTVRSATKQNQEMVNLLKQLKDSATEGVKQQIEDMLDHVCADLPPLFFFRAS